MADLTLTVTEAARMSRVLGGGRGTVVDLLTAPDRAVTEDATRWDRIRVLAPSVAALRAALPRFRRVSGVTSTVEVTVAGRVRPDLLSVPQRVGIRGLAHGSRSVTSGGTPVTRLVLAYTAHVTVADALAAVLEGGVSTAGRPLTGLRVAILDDSAQLLPWACGDPAATEVDQAGLAQLAASPHTVDLVLAGSPADPDLPGLTFVQPSASSSWSDVLTMSGEDVQRLAASPVLPQSLPPVDTRCLNPVGFVVDASSKVGRVTRVGRRRSVMGSTGEVLAVVDDRDGLDEHHVASLRSLQALVDDPTAHAGPAAHAFFLAQAASAALPVVTGALPRPTRALLGSDLAGTLARHTAVELGDPMVREGHCVALSREAMLRHSGRSRWADIAAAQGVATPGPATVSVIMATKRPHLLHRLGEQVMSQDWPDIELVVGLHGFDRSHPDVLRFERTFRGHLVVVPVEDERSFGAMLNELTARASGVYLAKMDDDDFYGPHHITDLVLAAEYSRADLVGSGAEFIYLEALDLTVRRQRTAGHRFTTRAPGAALLIGTDTLRAVGGWRPIAQGLDTALAKAVSDSGGSVYRTHGLGFMVFRGAAGHTWNPGDEYFLRNRPQQWAGFRPPPEVIGSPPSVQSLPPTWLDSRPAHGAHHAGPPAPVARGRVPVGSSAH